MDFGYGIGGVIVLILDIWALINILQSGASNVEKLPWILLITVADWLHHLAASRACKALTLAAGGLNYQFH